MGGGRRLVGSLLAVAGALWAACYAAMLALAPSDVPALVRRSSLYSCPWPEHENAALTAARSASRRQQRIMLYQDADANYAPLLNLTHNYHSRYARRLGYTFRTAVGSKSGFPYPTLNRVWALNEELANAQGPAGRGRRKGKHDWFVYMDADALVYEPRCSVEALLRNRSASASALLLCHDPMGDKSVLWHVNAGVFVANLRHPLLRPLACTWRRRLHWEAWRRQALATRLFRRLVLGKAPQVWVDDQRVLQEILAEYGPRYPSLAQVSDAARRLDSLTLSPPPHPLPPPSSRAATSTYPATGSPCPSS